MSKNCVDSAIELSNENDIPLFLIASRRQIECSKFGGGYVNGWTTESFAEYVISNDKKGRTILARDHGGPWQHPNEIKNALSLRRAMESAKESYEVDIRSGLQVIHIDPSVDPNGSPTVDQVLERVYELYSFCWEVAQKHKKEIIFEIGTEEQSGSTNTLEALEYVLNSMIRFCATEKLPVPSFVVMQTGTRVLETRNVGSFDSPIRIAGELPAEIQVPRMLDLCRRFNIFMKEHNTDYLSDESLRWHPKLGIHAANVAPEFGVAESRALVQILNQNDLPQLRDRFLQLSFESKKWEKWMVSNTTASDIDRAIISGHYVFSTPEFSELLGVASTQLQKKSVDLNSFLKNAVKKSIHRYLRLFNVVNP